ncbi:MAG: ATP-binding protein [Prevotella sp.]|nr:ATP-binding protein [Prevotella sp.]
MTERYYPIGIQTFSEIIREGYVYVDKTDLMWRLQNKKKYIFLARPRRFGKSLLSSTFHSFFDGNRQLFEGLKVMQLEKEWQQYPVLHLDLSGAKHMTPADTRQELNRQFEPYEQLYGANPIETLPGMKMAGIVRRAYEKEHKQVAVIIDEYDAPLLDVLHDDNNLKEMREVLQEFYQRLKMLDPYLKFCFITGITKFSQLSIFSTINNLYNVSMLPEYSAICGITETELTTQLWPDIELMAKANGYTPEEMHQRLKLHYDGYHFSKDSEEVYNPFSLIKAFASKDTGAYWFDSGTPTFLIRQLQHFRTDIMGMERIEVPAAAFDKPTEAMNDALPLLYQSGYLTIKDYDRETQEYTLSIPNQEVRIGYTEGLLPAYSGLMGPYVQSGFAAKFWKALRKDDIDLAMQELQAYMASLPYVEGFKKKLEEAATKEGFYEYTLYLIFSMLNVYVRTQVKCRGGRTDMVVWMPDTTYVFEFKTDGTAEEALRQIDDKGYAFPYNTDGRRVVKVGVKFNADDRTPESWVAQTT